MSSHGVVVAYQHTQRTRINLSTLSTLLLPGPQAEAKLLTSGRREVFMLSRMLRKKDREEGKNG